MHFSTLWLCSCVSKQFGNSLSKPNLPTIRIVHSNTATKQFCDKVAMTDAHLKKCVFCQNDQIFSHRHNTQRNSYFFSSNYFKFLVNIFYMCLFIIQLTLTLTKANIFCYEKFRVCR